MKDFEFDWSYSNYFTNYPCLFLQCSLWNDLIVESQSKDSVETFKKQFAVENKELQTLYY